MVVKQATAAAQAVTPPAEGAVAAAAEGVSAPPAEGAAQAVAPADGASRWARFRAA